MGRNWTHPTWHNRRVARTKVITCFNVRLSRETGESRRRVFWPTTQRKRDCRRRRRRRRRGERSLQWRRKQSSAQRRRDCDCRRGGSRRSISRGSPHCQASNSVSLWARGK